MGNTGSRFDKLPVTDHRTGIAVIPVNGKFETMRPEKTFFKLFKLHEKSYAFSENECIIKVRIS